METIIMHNSSAGSVEDLKKEVDLLNIKLHSTTFKNQELEKEIQDKKVQQKKVCDEAIAIIRAITACLEFSECSTHRERNFAERSIIRFADNAILRLEQMKENDDYPF